jgi:hypothetical protein
MKEGNNRQIRRNERGSSMHLFFTIVVLSLLIITATSILFRNDEEDEQETEVKPKFHYR